MSYCPPHRPSGSTEEYFRKRFDKLQSVKQPARPHGGWARHCVYCGDVGPRTRVAGGGWAHKRCMPNFGTRRDAAILKAGEAITRKILRAEGVIK